MSMHSAEDIPADELIDRMISKQKEEEAIEKFFHLGGGYDFRRAFDTYADECPVYKCPFFTKSGELVHHRGHGAFIWDRKPRTYKPFCSDTKEFLPRVIYWSFEVSIWHEEEDKEKSVQGHVVVPPELITNFFEMTFNSWIAEYEEKSKKRRTEEAEYFLQEHYKKFPDIYEGVVQ